MAVPASVEHHISVRRTARYYTLGGDGSRAPRHVWIVLHGYSQLASQFIGFFADAASPERLVVAPEALNRYYLLPPEAAAAADRPVGATWMTRADREHEIEDYVAYLDAVYEALEPRISRDTRVEVIGFSQGAATAARWLLRGRGRVDRLILWGGLLPPEAPLDSPALRVARLTLVVGDRDRFITAERLSAEEARLEAAGVRFTTLRFAGSHAIKRDVVRRIAEDER